ncbi:MAG TPA: hypothetical protein VFU04_06660 [Solirubrobacterales bacterium]|nr:hypothetical protein [Solirubrobacterales bacterium]
MIYTAIGKVVVKSFVFFLRYRYGRAMRIGAGVATVVVGAALYLANRNVPEG